MDRKDILLNKQRIVIKVGTSTITYEETGNINLEKLEKFVRILINLRNKGKEVIVVSSGAVGVGKNALGMDRRPQTESEKQACAAVGQGKLMMIYEKLFNEYGQLTAQVLLTKESVTNAKCRKNAKQTFDELFKMQVVPIVNENDAISVDELSYGNFGDNDTLAALTASLWNADLMIILSDIDGVYDKDPKTESDAKLIDLVENADRLIETISIGGTSSFGTGGIASKIEAASRVNKFGIPMLLLNGEKENIIRNSLDGKSRGTLFLGTIGK